MDDLQIRAGPTARQFVPNPNVYQSVELRGATVVGFDSGSNDRAVGPWRFLGPISQAASLGYANGWAFGPDHGQPERV